ncbi:glycine-rich domain-containing protein [Streptomyces xanthophaeus]
MFKHQGSFNYTVPAGYTKVRVQILGGGGAGGGGGVSNRDSMRGGGAVAGARAPTSPAP